MPRWNYLAIKLKILAFSIKPFRLKGLGCAILGNLSIDQMVETIEQL